MGLNTAMAENDLPPAYAARCRNLLLNDGRMQPRPPMQQWNPSFTNQVSSQTILGGVYWRSPLLGDIVICKTVAEQNGFAQLWAVPRNTGETELANTANFNLSPHAPTFVAYNGFIHVLDGSPRMLKTDGSIVGTRFVGLVPPPANMMTTQIGAGAIDATVSYAVTFYNNVTLVESNPIYSAQIANGPATGNTLSFNIPAYAQATSSGITHLRIYRRNHTLGQVGWRLLQEPTIAAAMSSINDAAGESTITASSETTGPFAPSRNHVPVPALHGCVWNGRLMTDDPAKPGLVRYSAVGIPDHQDPSDFLDFSGDPDDRIGGMAELASQLVVGKRRAIHVASGVIGGPTNLTVATGALPIESQIALFKTRATIGPATMHGPGFFVCGQPARIYFGGDGGLGVFDGSDAVYVSDPVRPTWVTMHATSVQRYTIAEDSLRGLLYICPAASPNFMPLRDGKPEYDDGFIYDYRNGRWGTFAAGYNDNVMPVNQEMEPSEVVTCMIQSVDLQARSVVLMGGNSGSLLIMSGYPFEGMTPRWHWRSGQICLADGFKLCVYGAKVYYEQAGSAVPGGEPRALVKIEMPPAGAYPVLRMLGMGSGRHDGFAVKRTSETAVVEISNESLIGAPMGWRERFGVTGFEFDAELSGQR